MLRRVTPLVAFVLALAAQTKDITGTWIAKSPTPMGEMEIVYRLRVDTSGNITGSQSLPFGDAPITGGKVSGDSFEFTVELDAFGTIQRREVKGKIVGDELQLTPAMPGPPPVNGPGAASPGPGPRMHIGLVTARRGVPTPSYRVSVDYKALPRVELPALKEIPSIGVANTPPMGWNSWNKFRTKIDDKTVRETAEEMVAFGMRDAGYVYVNIDDGWQDKRDSNGVLQPNPQFPNMKALADFVHSKGLKLGIYSSPGPQTCGGFTGSYGHEDIDAKTWADWGIDYLKYDWCSASRIWKDEDMHAAYQRMGEALQNTGRPMVYALCQYGRADVEAWGPKVGASLWRTTRDIQDRWQSMTEIGFSQPPLAFAVKPGNWNDPDMLEIGNGGMSTEEYKTHFSLWAMLAAPLIAGNDLRAMSPEIKNILLNPEVIAVDQDPLGKRVQQISKSDSAEVWGKPLLDGAYVIGLFNKSERENKLSVDWSELKLKGPLHMRDLWKHSDLGVSDGGFSGMVPAHGTLLLKLTQ